MTAIPPPKPPPGRRPPPPHGASEAASGALPRQRHSLAPAAPLSSYHRGLVIAGKYELERPLGEGGMGTVWRARNRVLDIPVALKLIPLGTSDEGAAAAAVRMLEEARTAARLGHPAIVRVLDYGQTTTSDPFIALELLTGEDLADVLARERRLPPLRAVQVLLPIADALALAHDHGIVHRDVKPENVFLAETDVGLQPKLLDFGIARFVDRPQRVTLEGSALGTPDYMSPEQARGDTLGPATDIWSFGVLLFELVSGILPFAGPNHFSLARSIMESPPRPLPPGLHGIDGLRPILERCLAKEPTQRFGTMRECGQALARWLQDSGVAEDITGAPLRRRWDPLASSGHHHETLRSNPPLDGPTPLSSPTPAIALNGAEQRRRAMADSESELAALARVGALGDALPRAARRGRWRPWLPVVYVWLLWSGFLALLLWWGGTFPLTLPRERGAAP